MNLLLTSECCLPPFEVFPVLEMKNLHRTLNQLLPKSSQLSRQYEKYPLSELLPYELIQFQAKRLIDKHQQLKNIQIEQQSIQQPLKSKVSQKIYSHYNNLKEIFLLQRFDFSISIQPKKESLILFKSLWASLFSKDLFCTGEIFDTPNRDARLIIENDLFNGCCEGKQKIPDCVTSQHSILYFLFMNEYTFNYLYMVFIYHNTHLLWESGREPKQRWGQNMELYSLRVGYSKEYLPTIAHIFGLGYYIPKKEEADDEYSKKVMYFYKYGNDLDFFIDVLDDLYQLRFEEDEIKFDILTAFPTHKKGILNSNMVKLVDEFSKKIRIPHKQLLIRNRDIKPNHELKTFEERIKNVEGSINIKEDITGKNIMIFDNVSISGISLISATSFLYENGAENVVCICLGLSNKNKKADWNDLNYTLQYSKIKKICKTPFVGKEEREKWKLTQSQR